MKLLPQTSLFIPLNLTSGLNPAQKEAVTAPFGPVLVLAGPGSGKTRVLTHRIAYLVSELDVYPYRIMSVTFTNKAAKEMRARVEKIVTTDLRGILMGTFHSTCARILRRESAALAQLGYSQDFVIFDSDDQRNVIKTILKERNLSDTTFQPTKILNRISRAKDKMITPELYEASDYMSNLIRRFYEQYQRTLIANNAMDFDDLLLNTVRLFELSPDVLEKYQRQYQHILVDEFQDTNSVQYSLLAHLARQHNNLFVVGDGDQSIYKWRGADFRNIQKFRDEYPTAKQILLEQNYRSTQLVLDAAMAVIQKNPERVHKNLFTERRGGRQIVMREAYNENEEAEQIVGTIAREQKYGKRHYGDFAVMYRTNAQSRVLEESFIHEGVPYKLVGATRFYGRREIKDVIAYLRVIHNLQDEVSLRRIINVPTRGVGAKTLAKLLEWGSKLEVQAGEAVIKLVTDPLIPLPFKGRALASLMRFGTMLNGWVRARDELSVGELVQRVLDETNYKTYIDDGTDEGVGRWENVKEFLGVALDAEETSLADFLETVALVADVDNLEAGSDAVTLLTLHASKGLEFPVVFIAGLEEGLVPHSRAKGDAEELAEERRLFYVGLTRAEEQLYLSHTTRRSLYGMSEMSEPSRFLGDIPTNLVEGGNRLSERHEAAKSRAWSWDQSATQQPKRATSKSYGKRSGFAEKRVKRKSWEKQAAPRRDLPKPRHLGEAREKPKAEAQYKSGQRVRHAKFGDGVVIESKVTKNDEEIAIAFSEYGIKRLSASFAKLERLA